ncbi:MAG: penicillin-binding protein activator, partial [Lysobacterales bacterium]
WIIGPLQKPEIETLLGRADLAIPLLALNHLPPGFITPPHLSGQINGISLSPEEEARALAQEIIQSGFSRVIILAPESEWGEHMAQTFQDNFLQENGQIVAYSRYREDENDHSRTLEQVLQIDESKARRQQLESVLQMSLRFEPVRRNDVDAIFLVANPNQGRLLRPQLRFYDAGDIPVYAPSRIYAGKPDALRDQDLNGVRFPTTPLQLNLNSVDSLSALASLRGGSFTGLYALGQDAWDLLPWLGLMRQDPQFPFAGASGTYTAGMGGNFRRDPAFAVFSEGIPVPLVRMVATTNPP